LSRIDFDWVKFLRWSNRYTLCECRLDLFRLLPNVLNFMCRQRRRLFTLLVLFNSIHFIVFSAVWTFSFFCLDLMVVASVAYLILTIARKEIFLEVLQILFTNIADVIALDNLGQVAMRLFIFLRARTKRLVIAYLLSNSFVFLLLIGGIIISVLILFKIFCFLIWVKILRLGRVIPCARGTIHILLGGLSIILRLKPVVFRVFISFILMEVFFLFSALIVVCRRYVVRLILTLLIRWTVILCICVVVPLFLVAVILCVLLWAWVIIGALFVVSFSVVVLFHVS
jgi:hypothetical protein